MQNESPTIMGRPIGPLADTSAWSPSWDGRWVLALILFAYFATLVGLARSRDLVSAWHTLGVAASPHPFLDARFVTGTADSYRTGYDPYVENPYDPFGRPMNYPRIWLALAALGLSQDHTMIVGIGLAVIYFGSLLCWAGRLNPAQGLILAAFLCSPHVMWMVERGNGDQVIFILLATALTLVRRHPEARTILYTSIIAASFLKYYPAAGLLTVVRERSWRALIWGLAILIAFFAYLLFTWPDPLLVVRATRHLTSFWSSYGRAVAFEYLAYVVLPRFGVVVGPSIPAVCSWVAVGIAVSIAALWAGRLPPISQGSSHLDSFLIGSGLFLGTFLIGKNYDYKLAFLVFLLPQTLTWIRDRGRLTLPAYLLLVFLMASVWIEPLLAALHHRPPGYGHPRTRAFLLQELTNWLLVTSILALDVAILRGWWQGCRREWGPAHVPSE
jgi:hypothetical protein